MLNEGDKRFVSYRNMRNRLAKSRLDEQLDLDPLMGMVFDFERTSNQNVIAQFTPESISTLIKNGDQLNERSRTEITVATVNYIVEPSLVYFIDQAIIAGRVDQLITWIDTLTGFERILTLIQLGKQTLSGELDSSLQSILKDIADSDGLEQTPLTESVQGYLAMLREGKLAAESLKVDPSGFKLIKSSIDRFSVALNNPGAPKEPYLPSNVIPEFFIRGARLAETTYATIYPLTETIS